jgi:hypothetical protein
MSFQEVSDLIKSGEISVLVAAEQILPERSFILSAKWRAFYGRKDLCLSSDILCVQSKHKIVHCRGVEQSLHGWI